MYVKAYQRTFPELRVADQMGSFGNEFKIKPPVEPPQEKRSLRKCVMVCVVFTQTPNTCVASALFAAATASWAC